MTETDTGLYPEFDETEAKNDSTVSTEKEMSKTNTQPFGDVVNLDSKLCSRSKFYINEKLIKDAKEKARMQLEDFPELIENKKAIEEFYSDDWNKDPETLGPIELEDEVAKLQRRINIMKEQNSKLMKEVDELENIKNTETEINQRLKDKIQKEIEGSKEETFDIQSGQEIISENGSN